MCPPYFLARAKLSGMPGIRVKPDLPKDERFTESLLLKECRLFITSGTNRSTIKIHGSTLYVEGRRHGVVANGKFEKLPLVSDFLPSPAGTVETSLPEPSSSLYLLCINPPGANANASSLGPTLYTFLNLTCQDFKVPLQPIQISQPTVADYMIEAYQ